MINNMPNKSNQIYQIKVTLMTPTRPSGGILVTDNTTLLSLHDPADVMGWRLSPAHVHHRRIDLW
jgi:hypothetical protein